MKRIFILILLISAIASSRSQSIEDAKRHLYYERYETAKNILRTIIAKGDASPDAWYWLGEVYLKQGKIKEANALLGDAVKIFTAKNLSKKKK